MYLTTYVTKAGVGVGVTRIGVTTIGVTTLGPANGAAAVAHQ